MPLIRLIVKQFYFCCNLIQTSTFIQFNSLMSVQYLTFCKLEKANKTTFIMVNELITIIDHIGAYAINYGLQNISTLSKIKC